MEAYPLTWPIGYQRTTNRIGSPFKQSMEKAQQFLRLEIERMGAKELIVSSNIPVRKDGMFFTDWMNRRIDDPGVAIYFKYRGKEVSMCCDQYARVWENVYALGKAIEALRGLERWGVSDFLNRAFTGFTALPPSIVPEVNIWHVIGLTSKPDNVDDVKAAYRKKANEYHPDRPTGDKDKFQSLQDAYEAALKMFE